MMNASTDDIVLEAKKYRSATLYMDFYGGYFIKIRKGWLGGESKYRITAQDYQFMKETLPRDILKVK